MFEGLGPGLGLMIAGLVLVLLVWFLLHLLRRNQPYLRSYTVGDIASDSLNTKDAVIIIQPGGRVEHLNSNARRLFDLRENEHADLERLARQIKPSDDFLALCADEGQKRISIGSRFAEASSYRVPGISPLMLITLRDVDLSPTFSLGENEVSGFTLQAITDFDQAVASNLNLGATLQAVFENVSKLLFADFLEIKVWNETDQSLVPYRFFEESAGKPPHMRLVEESYFGEYSHSLSTEYKTVFLPRLDIDTDVITNGTPNPFAVRSYIGVPLLTNGKFVGTLEAGRSIADGFGDQDVELLQLIAGQAAVVVRNSLHYEKQERRAAELTSIAKMAQAVSVGQEMQGLFEQLVKSVSPLFDVDIIGFLLFDENEKTLEGQIPFQGLPPHIVEMYRTTISLDGPVSTVLSTSEPLLTFNAAEDDMWESLGLRNLAQAASLRDAALIPLRTDRRFIGFLQLSNHRQAAMTFSQEELRQMRVIANQASVVIDNAVLLQQSSQRAYRSDALRRIANLSASATSTDEMLEDSLRELAHLFNADTAAIFLLDEEKAELRLHTDSLFGVKPEVVDSLARLKINNSQFRLTVSGSQRPFLSGQLSNDQRVLPVYRPIVTTLQMESSLVAPLVVREHSLGELMLGSRNTEFFNSYDLQAVTTAAGQLATALENARLMTQTDENLQARVDQLTAIMRISRELTAALDLPDMLQVIHDESLRITHADCGTIILFDVNDNNEGSEERRIKLSIGCEPDEKLSALLSHVLGSGEPLVVSDFDDSEFETPHEGVRSALIVTILQQGEIAGVIHLHAKRPRFFTEDIVDLIQTMAVQISIALNTAAHSQIERQRAALLQLQANSMSSLREINCEISFDRPLEEQLKLIGDGIRNSTPFQAVLFSIYEPETGLLRRDIGVGVPQETLNELLSNKQSLTSVQYLLKPEFQIGRAYFIPAEKTPVIPADLHTVTLDVNGNNDRVKGAWNPDDFLIVPLNDNNGDPVGLISLDKPRDGLRPDKAIIEIIEIFAAQATLVISNWIRFDALQNQVESLTSGVQRQQRLLSVSQNDLPLLLRKDLEHSISIYNLDQKAQRVHAGLAITESVSRQLNASSALMALGREVLTQLGMSVALVAENTLDGPRLLHVMGRYPRGSNPETLFGQRNPLRTCLQEGELILIENVNETDEWRDTPLISGLQAKAFICLPITLENQIVAALLACSPEPLQALTDEDRQVFSQIARQTSVILQNISLLNEARSRLKEVNLLLDFSRQITGLDSIQILEALLKNSLRVIQAAHAGIVLFWDEVGMQLVPKMASGYVDNEAMMQIKYKSGEALPGRVFENKESRRIDELDFAREYVLSPENLFRFRQATGGRLPIASLVTPLVAGSQGLGVLVMDNFNTQAAFTEEDEALLLSLSQQVALSLENVRLVQETQEHAGQLQALNDVATSMTSSLQSDELVSSLLEQLRPVIPYDTATLLLRNKDQLKVAAASGFADSEKRLGLTVAVADSALFQEMIRRRKPISVADVREDTRFPQIEAPRLSWLGLPLVSKGEVIGVIALEKWQASFYSAEIVQVATTFAGQAAVALENARLYEESLSRSAELDRRSQRLALLNRFSSLMSGLLNAEEIQRATAQELKTAFHATRVLAINFDDQIPILIYASPKRRVKVPQVLPDAPLFGRLHESLGVFSCEDFQNDPDLTPLAFVLGEKPSGILALPLASGEHLRSILIVQLPVQTHLSASEIELALTIANQASIAQESARLFQEAQRHAQETAVLAEIGRDVSATLEVEAILERIVTHAGELLDGESTAVYLPDVNSDTMRAVAVIGKEVTEIKNDPLRIGEGILGDIAKKKHGEIVNYAEDDPRTITISGTVTGSAEHVMGVPILSKGHLSGLMVVWRSGKGVEFTSTELDFLTSLAQQAAIALENARLFAETQRLAEELEQRVIDRTAELEREKSNTETLLRILTEVSSSLDLDRALSRTLALLNDAVGAEQGTIMLLQADDNLLHYRAGYGYLTGKAPLEGTGFTLKIGEGLAGWVVQTRESVLVEDLYKDLRWVKAGTTSSQHRSSIVTPLLVGEDVIGVLMVFHRKVGFFGPERLGMVKAIAGQVAIAINNAHLYELIRDQAERLGTMLRKEQEEASRSQAILEAVADGVVVTGPDNRITFLNNSAARILSLEPGSVMQKSLDDFVGIFGNAVSTWTQTINDWSNEPSSYQAGDSYAEQLELEDGRIALVHLAPVILQNDFLGTVSIFRDITHEVEVDRLKSEFVATVSHELRTPMTSIRGYVDILLMGAAGALNENQTHFLDIVKNNTERLNILVNDLLDISRIEAGRVKLSPQPIDLREIARDVLADFSRRSEEEKKVMTFTLEAAKSIPPVRGDSERVRQVLGNLVDNAYHYTPENGQVTVQLQAMNGSEVQVDVQDSGVGILPDDQERIFDRFYRGENPLVLATPGTGLGLAIVKQLVEMHNGRIWLTSEGDGKGATFSFTLPVYSNDE